MTVVSRYESGLYQVGENALLMDDGKYHATGTRKCILVRGGHGSDGTSNGPLGGGFYFEPIRALVETGGYTVYNINAAGGASWWNAASTTAVVNAIARLKSIFGITKVALFGASMGGGVFVQALKTVHADVCGTALLSPALDLDFFHGTSGYTPTYSYTGVPIGVDTTEIETAYSTNAAGWVSATSGHRIRDEYASWSSLGPIKIWHGDADTTVPHDASLAFVNGVGISATLRTLIGAGHVPPIPSAGGPPLSEYLGFFNSLSWS